MYGGGISSMIENHQKVLEMILHQPKTARLIMEHINKSTNDEEWTYARTQKILRRLEDYSWVRRIGWERPNKWELTALGKAAYDRATKRR